MTQSMIELKNAVEKLNKMYLEELKDMLQQGRKTNTIDFDRYDNTKKVYDTELEYLSRKWGMEREKIQMMDDRFEMSSYFE